MASDWADEVRGVLHKLLVDHGCDMAIRRHVDAAIESLRIPGDCVRLPDGRVVKVLGTLPMTADGCIVGSGGCVFGPSPIEGDSRIITYDWIPPATVSDGDRLTIMAERAYSTRAAAEAARGEGSNG